MKKYYMPGLKNLTPNSITKPKFLLCQLSYLPSNFSLMLVQSLEILLCNVIWNLIIFSYSELWQIERPLQRHGGRLEHNETYCGSCYGAEMVCFSVTLINSSIKKDWLCLLYDVLECPFMTTEKFKQTSVFDFLPCLL